MLRLLALAAHFSPLNPGPYDPAVVELLNTYFEPELPKKSRVSEVTAASNASADESRLEAA
jgi:hypothetical protein